MRTTEIIEALLFASDAPLTAADLARADEDLDEDAVEQAILALRAEYDATGRAFQVYEIAGGYQLLTRPEYAAVLERFHTVPQSGRLSGPALEVLAIIAYRQPIGRTEIEEIRGIGSAGVLRTLQDRQLIDVVGRGEGLGRPLLYGTTQKFLDHFGFNSLHDLPRPDELPVVLKQRGPAEASEAEAGAAAQPAPEQAAPSANGADHPEAAHASPPEPEQAAEAPPDGPSTEAAAAEAPDAVAADERPAAEMAEAEAAAADPAPQAPEAETTTTDSASEMLETEAATADPAPEEAEAAAADPASEAPPNAGPEVGSPEPPAAHAVPEPAEGGPAARDDGAEPDRGPVASNGAGQVHSQVQATAAEPGASAN